MQHFAAEPQPPIGKKWFDALPATKARESLRCKRIRSDDPEPEPNEENTYESIADHATGVIGGDPYDTCTELDKIKLQDKAIYLIAALKFVLSSYPRSTWTECCKRASETCSALTTLNCVGMLK